MDLSWVTSWLVVASSVSLAGAGDQPQWGSAWERNMVSTERGLPTQFDPASGQNVKWSAALGTESYSTPVVGGGKVYVGTNNGEPRDPKHAGDRGVLMCFAEADGELLWQLVVPKREDDPYYDWPKSGISSPATLEGDNVYLVDNRGVVLCLDADGLADGNDGDINETAHLTPKGAAPVKPGPLDADIIWRFDLTAGAGIWSHDAAHTSILIHGPHLYLNTGTGVDNTHRKIRTPDAPSLVVLDKATGRLLARDREGIAPNIFHATWSSPSLGVVAGKPLVFFAGGDGKVYAFEPVASADSGREVQSLKKAWQFDCDPTAPKENVHRYNTNRREGPSNIYGMPVFDRGRVYVAGGGDIFWGKTEAWLQCIDAGKTGDITGKGLIWRYPLQKHVLATPAVYQGLVFIADCGRTMHCVDAASGQPVWTHEINGEVWASAYVADDKVYLGTRRGDFYVFAASRNKKLLHTVSFRNPIAATATAANECLYVATMNRLYALALTKGAVTREEDDKLR